MFLSRRDSHAFVLPTHTYTPLQGSFPYTLAVSQHAVVTKDSLPRAKQYWINICYPTFEAAIELIYKPVKSSAQLLREYCADAYKLTAKHQGKAASIQEQSFTTRQEHLAIMAERSGQVPSSMLHN